MVTFTPRWVPPTGYHQGKCTAAQRQTYRTVCLGTQSDGGAACRAFVGTAEGQNACEGAATGCGCSAYAAKSACVDLFVGADRPAAACMGADFDTAYATAVDAFCGSP